LAVNYFRPQSNSLTCENWSIKIYLPLLQTNYTAE
jgi:hypothetical protein